MKEIDVRKVMYGQTKKIGKKPNTNEVTNLKASRDVILIESGGVKQFVPSMLAFKKLLEDYDVLKNEHHRAIKELKTLREAMTVMIRSVNDIDEELKKKVDKLDY